MRARQARRGSDDVSGEIKGETLSPDALRALVARRGLARAYDLFPDAVRTAAERGARSLAAPDLPSNTEPAAHFDPARFGMPE